MCQFFSAPVCLPYSDAGVEPLHLLCGVFSDFWASNQKSSEALPVS